MGLLREFFTSKSSNIAGDKKINEDRYKFQDQFIGITKNY